MDVSAEVRAKACVDVAGRKQGPFRLWANYHGTLPAEGTYRDGFLDGVVHHYDEEGVLTNENSYATGALIAFKPTFAALQATFDHASAEAQAAGKNRTLVLLDRRPLGVEYVKKPPLSFLLAAAGDDLNGRMRRKLVSDFRFCQLSEQLSRLPGFPIDRMRARWIDDDGKLLVEVWLQQEECGDPNAR